MRKGLSKTELQRRGVLAILQRGGKFSLYDFITELGLDPLTAIDSRIRDLRKPEHGNHIIKCKPCSDGVYRYELIGENNEAA